jgi:hypothetical protein
VIRGLTIAVAALLASCGGNANAVRTAPVRAECAAGQHLNGSSCSARGDGELKIKQGASALAEFRVDEALPLLESARSAGPYAHATHIQLYQQLGIAYAYGVKDDKSLEVKALTAFDMLLTLDPGHVLSYNLSPQATLLFERARRAANERAKPAVDLDWPRQLDVTQPVPLEVEVVSDPKGYLKRATLHVRKKGEQGFEAVDLTLRATGDYQQVVLPAPGSSRAEVLQVYLTAFDSGGNEVLRLGSPREPREIALSYEPPTPWYRKWWVWAAVGGVVAVGTGITVFAVLDEPSDLIGGTFGVR